MISFIVIGKNEGWKLKKCLLSIQEVITQYKLDDYEIIYVDSDSDDGSVDFAQQIKDIHIIKILNYTNAAIARNVGAEFSNGDILFFLDGDMEIISSNFKYFFTKKMDRLIYPFLSGDFLDNCYENKFSIEILSSNLHHKIKKVSMQAVTGGLFFIERRLWKSVEGMRSEFRISEDLDIGLRLSKKGVLLKRLPHTLVIHHTVSYRDRVRFWLDFKNGNYLYRGMLIRKNLFNKRIVKEILFREITLYFLIISILAIISYGNLAFLFLFLFLTFIKVIRKSALSNLLQNILRSIVIDFNTLFGFLFFYPKPKNKRCKVEVVK